MNRTILITGANGNLGNDVVNQLHAEGHTLLATTGSTEMHEHQKRKHAHVQRVNLLSESETHKFMEHLIRHYPHLDAVVLLAGGFAMGEMSATDEALLDQQIGLNFKSAWFVIKPVMEHFRQMGHGQLILVGARPALQPADGKHAVAYALSKSLLFTLAEIINAEGKESGITASVIVPSTIDTPANRKGMPNAHFDRWVKTTDVAKVISFILSETGSQLRQPVYKIYNKA